MVLFAARKARACFAARWNGPGPRGTLHKPGPPDWRSRRTSPPTKQRFRAHGSGRLIAEVSKVDVPVLPTRWRRSGTAAPGVEQSPPLPRPRPPEAPSRPAPYPAEKAKPEPILDQACLDRLGAAGIEFTVVTLPPGAKPECLSKRPSGSRPSSWRHDERPGGAWAQNLARSPTNDRRGFALPLPDGASHVSAPLAIASWSIAWNARSAATRRRRCSITSAPIASSPMSRLRPVWLAIPRVIIARPALCTG